MNFPLTATDVSLWSLAVTIILVCTIELLGKISGTADVQKKLKWTGLLLCIIFLVSTTASARLLSFPLQGTQLNYIIIVLVLAASTLTYYLVKIASQETKKGLIKARYDQSNKA